MYKNNNTWWTDGNRYLSLSDFNICCCAKTSYFAKLYYTRHREKKMEWNNHLSIYCHSITIFLLSFCLCTFALSVSFCLFGYMYFSLVSLCVSVTVIIICILLFSVFVPFIKSDLWWDWQPCLKVPVVFEIFTKFPKSLKSNMVKTKLWRWIF